MEALIKRFNDDGKPEPPALLDFMRRLALKKMKKPRQHGASPAKHYWRKRMAAMLIGALEGDGFQVGKRDLAKNEHKNTASDIVAEVFNELGDKSMTYAIARNAFYSNNKSM